MILSLQSSNVMRYCGALCCSQFIFAPTVIALC